MRLVRGRDFSARDDAAGARVAIVSEAMAKRFWPGEDPMGKIIRAGGSGLTPREVVGVSHDLLDPAQSGAAAARRPLAGRERLPWEGAFEPAGAASLRAKSLASPMTCWIRRSPARRPRR